MPERDLRWTKKQQSEIIESLKTTLDNLRQRATEIERQIEEAKNHELKEEK